MSGIPHLHILDLQKPWEDNGVLKVLSISVGHINSYNMNMTARVKLI